MDWLRAIVLFFAVAASGNELKVGGPIQNTGVGEYGKKAFEMMTTWVNAQTNVGGTGTGAYTIKLMLENFANSGAITTLVEKMTTSGDAKYVDVLICPYGSGDSKTCIEAVKTGYTGPVMIWGGASDSLFGTGNPCANKNCIGTFTPGSQYAASALDMLDTKMTATLNVALVENNNGFSQSVCSGANTKISSLAGLATAADMKMTGSQKSTFPQADKDKLKAILDKNPDVVVICGHNGFVEPAIIEIKNHASKPKAIIATNALTTAANTQFGSNIAHQACVMMPTQWKEGTAKDSITNMDTNDFKTNLGAKATYHAASAAAAGIAILHAMKDKTDFATAKSNLFTNLKALDTDSFYGKLKFNANGQITKAMATQQKQGSNVVFVDTAGKVQLCSGGGGCPPCPVPVVAPAPAVSTPATAPVPSPVPKISVTAPTPVPQVAPVPSPVPQMAVTAPTPVPQAAPTPVPVPYTPPPAPVPQTAPVPVPVPYLPPPAPVPQTAPSPVPVPPPPVPVPQTAPVPSPVPQVSMTAPTPVPQVAPVPSPVPKVAVTAPTPVPQTAPAPSPVVSGTPASTPAVVPAPTCPSCTTASTDTDAAHAADHMGLVLLMACALALHF